MGTSVRLVDRTRKYDRMVTRDGDQVTDADLTACACRTIEGAQVTDADLLVEADRTTEGDSVTAADRMRRTVAIGDSVAEVTKLKVSCRAAVTCAVMSEVRLILASRSCKISWADACEPIPT